MKRPIYTLDVVVLILLVLFVGHASAQDPYWNERNALVALRMAVGLQAPDLAMDVDGDGQVTDADALQILRWAVAGVLRETTAGFGGELMVKSEDEALQIADATIAAELPDMAGAERAAQSYETPRGSFYDVTYRSRLEVEADGESLTIPRIVIVSVDRSTGETAVAVSD